MPETSQVNKYTYNYAVHVTRILIIQNRGKSAATRIRYYRNTVGSAPLWTYAQIFLESIGLNFCCTISTFPGMLHYRVPTCKTTLLPIAPRFIDASIVWWHHVGTIQNTHHPSHFIRGLEGAIDIGMAKFCKIRQMVLHNECESVIDELSCRYSRINWCILVVGGVFRTLSAATKSFCEDVLISESGRTGHV